jgi:hypothetical protein
VQEVEDTDESAIYERATWDRLPLKKWSAAGGRVVLMGDAAHAMYSGGQAAAEAQHGPCCTTPPCFFFTSMFSGTKALL